MISDEKSWAATRQIVLGRDNFQCIECSVKDNLHVHHLIPRHLGGNDAPANLITLCSACHAARHPNLQVSLSRRFIEHWALRLARLFDSDGELPKNSEQLALALRIMGKDRFIDGQLQIVLAALRGESLLAVRPTGSGKSLCFQLPAILSSRTTFVLTPLKALMQDQVSGLQRLKIPASFINSDLGKAEKVARYELLEQGALKLMYLTPERFDPTVVTDQGEIERLCNLRPSYLVVDEAHCVDRWGGDFRPSYGRIHEVLAKLGTPPTLAFTATAGVKAQRRILDAIGIPAAKVVVSDVDRPNIALIRHDPKSDRECYDIATKIIASCDGKVMIFVPTRKVGTTVSQVLEKMGHSAPFYHSQLPSIDKEMLFGRFAGRIHPELDAIVCTNAFGMGIDIPNVRAVIHWMQPESVEDYLQEFGRAGRDGNPSVALIFKNKDAIGLREFMAEKSAEQASRNGIDGTVSYQRKLESISDLDSMIGNRRVCFRKQIMDYFQAGTPSRPSIAVRIVEWLLGRRMRVKRSAFCCDACDTFAAKKYLGIK